MIEFIGIWYNTKSEVKRDRTYAKDAAEASAKIHAKYAGREEPAIALTIIPANGYQNNPGRTHNDVSGMGYGS